MFLSRCISLTTSQSMTIEWSFVHFSDSTNRTLWYTLSQENTRVRMKISSRICLRFYAGQWNSNWDREVIINLMITCYAHIVMLSNITINSPISQLWTSFIPSRTLLTERHSPWASSKLTLSTTNSKDFINRDLNSLKLNREQGNRRFRNNHQHGKSHKLNQLMLTRVKENSFLATPSRKIKA